MAHKKASVLQKKKHNLELSDKEKHRLDIVEKFWFKLQQKFKKMGDTFRFFDKNYDNQISFKEFRVVCEELDMRMDSNELKYLFSYLDKDGGGSIGYSEFIMLCDEKRRGLDPLENAKKNVKMADSQRDQMLNKDTGLPNTLGNKTDDIMSVFENRKDMFDIENYKGKNKNPLIDARQELEQCTATKTQDYKFRKL